MPESSLSYLAMIVSGVVTAGFAYLAARHQGRSSLAISHTENSTSLTIDERASIRAEAEALRQEVRVEMDRLRAENQSLRERLGKVESELNSTRLANITLEHDRARLTDKVADLEAEVRMLRRQMSRGEP